MKFGQSMSVAVAGRNGMPDFDFHVQIHRQCGLCHYTFQIDERMVSLLHFEGRVHVNDAEYVTDHGYCLQGRNRKVAFCKIPNCRRCPRSGETATLHTDCFNLYMQKSRGTRKNKVLNVWIASVAMFPWRQYASLLLPFEPLGPKYVQEVIRSWKTPLIQRLPNEIQQIIIQLTQNHCSWRYGVVLEQAHHLSRMNLAFPMTPRRLNHIQSWRREELPLIKPIQEEDEDDSDFVRITIDSSGIEEITRVRIATEDFTPSPVSSNKLFVIEKASQLAKVEAQFMVSWIPDAVF